MLALIMVLSFLGGVGPLDGLKASAASNPAPILDYSRYYERNTLSYDPNTIAAGSYTDITLSNSGVHAITTSGAYKISGQTLTNSVILIDGDIEVDLIIDNVSITNNIPNNQAPNATSWGISEKGLNITYMNSPLIIADGAKAWVTFTGTNRLIANKDASNDINAGIAITLSSSLIITERSDMTNVTTVQGGRCSAGIGGWHDSLSGFIMINGGNLDVGFSPNSSLNQYAAIGGGHYNGSSAWGAGSWCPGIVVNGGIINAVGGHVGIGSWFGTTSGVYNTAIGYQTTVASHNNGVSFVEINGGTITGRNGFYGAHNDGAIIGFVLRNNITPVHVNGGDITVVQYGAGAGIGGSATIGNTVNAVGEVVSGNPRILIDMRNGGGQGAGIGGGGLNNVTNPTSGGNYGTAAGDMLIMGGDITIYASQYAAGIGGGGGMMQGGAGAGGNIDITGGKFTIYGGEYGAAIGGAGNSYGGANGGDVEITGGVFTIYGGVYGAGVGGGGSLSGTAGEGGNVIIAADTSDSANNMFNIYVGNYGAGIGGGGSRDGNGGSGGNSVEIKGGNFNIETGYSYTAAGTPSVSSGIYSYGAGIGGGGAGGSGTGGSGSNSLVVSGGRFNSTSNGYGAGIGGGGSNTGTAGSGGTARYEGGTVEVAVPGDENSLSSASVGSVGMGGGHVLSGGGSRTTNGEVTIIGGNIYTEIDSIVNGDPTQHAWTLPNTAVNTTTTAIKIELDESEIGGVPDQIAYRYNGIWHYDYGTNDTYVTEARDSQNNRIGILWAWVPSEYLLEYNMTSGSSTYTGTLANGAANDFDIDLATREAVGHTYVAMEVENPMRVYNYPGETKTLLEWNELIESDEVYDGASWNSMAPANNFHTSGGDLLYNMAEHPQVTGYDVYLIGWTTNENGVEHIFADNDGWDYTQYVVDEVNFTNTDIKVYAVWGFDMNGNGLPDVRENDFMLHYHANGGLGSPTNTMKYRHNSVAGIASVEPTNLSHVFIGWAETEITTPFAITDTVADLPSVMYRNSSTKTYNGTTLNYDTTITFTNGDINLYAIWAVDTTGNDIPDFLENIYYLQHDGSGANIASVPEDLPFVDGQTGTSSQGAGVLTWTGANHIFLGWTENSSAVFLLTGSHTAADIPADLADPLTLSAQFDGSNKTVYAVWAEDENDNGTPDYLDDAYYFLYNTQTSATVSGVPGDSTPYNENDFISISNNNLLDKTNALASGGMTEYMRRNGHVLIGWMDTVPAENDYTVSMANTFYTNNGNKYPNDASFYGSTYLTSVANVGPNSDGTFGTDDISIYAVWAVDSNNNGLPDWEDEDGRVMRYIPTIPSAINNTIPFYNSATPGVYRDEGPSTGSDFTGYTSNETVALSTQIPQSSGDYVFLGWSPVYIGGQVFGENGLNKTEFFALLALLEDITNGTDVSGNNNVGHMLVGTGRFAQAEYTKITGVSDLYDQAQAQYQSNGNSLSMSALHQIYDSFDWAGNYSGQGFMETVTFDSFDATMMNLGHDEYSKTWRAYAIWSKDVNGNGIADIFEDDYSLHYRRDVSSPTYTAATGGPTSEYNKYPGQVAALNTTNKPGKLDSNNNPMIFLGWTVDQNVQEYYGFGDAAIVPALASAVTFGDFDITVYAVWALDTDNNGVPDVHENSSYTLTYNANGGIASSVPVDNSSYIFNDTVTVNTATIPTHSGGHIFLYWTDNASAAATYGYNDGPLLPNKVINVTFAASNVTLYAVWGEDINNNGTPDVYENSYSMTYVANGGSGAVVDSNNPYFAGDNVTVLANGFARSGYTFSKWNTAADGSGISYNPGATFSIAADVTLYAQWTANGGNSGNGGTGNGGGGIPDGGAVLEKDKHILYIIGYPHGGVRPEANITRGEAAMIFFRLLSDSAHGDKDIPVANRFADMDGTEWHAQAINYLAMYNIIAGYADGTFHPDSAITRAEFASMASRFDELVATDGNAFADVGSDHWAVSYINSAAKKGWITGYEDSTFRAEQYISRSETVTLVNRVLDRAMGENAFNVIPNPYNDIAKEHWAYRAMMEASYAHEYTRDSAGNEIWDLSQFRIQT